MKMKVTDLKKQLKQLDQKELIELVVDMFKSNKDVQNFLSSKFIGVEAIKELFQKSRKKIESEFFPDRGNPKLRLAEAKKEITTFKKLTNDEKRTVDLMLYYVELGVDFTCAYGDISEGFYSSMIKMFDQVTIQCDLDEELYKELSERLERVVSRAPEGWGFQEFLLESYYTIGWVQEDDE
jgi:hypothetical protein